jgi:hypothetical protein
MSTPVQQLPRPAAPASAGSVSDPVVRDVLMEMEKEVASATAPPAPKAPPQHMMMPPHMMGPPQYRGMYGPPPPAAGWWNAENAKRAVVAALLAIMLLHPTTGELLGSRVSLFGDNETYNIIVRAALLAATLYVLMWKLEL